MYAPDAIVVGRGYGPQPLIEPVFTMYAAPACCRIRGTKASMPWITPWTFTPSTQLQSSAEVPTSGLKTCTPALLQSRRTSPYSS